MCKAEIVVLNKKISELNQKIKELNKFLEKKDKEILYISNDIINRFKNEEGLKDQNKIQSIKFKL